MYTTHPRYYPETTHDLGSFDVRSGELIVSDPCYSLDTWCQGKLGNVRNGEWRAAVVKGKTDWGNHCWAVLAVHKDFPLKTTAFPELTDIHVGVDSGQAGIFDAAEYHGGEDDYGDDGWYDLACKQTLDTKLGAGVLKGGVVSSSGFGDGGYECHVARDGEQIVGVKITFIVPEDFIPEQDDSDWGEESGDDEGYN